MAHRQMTGRQAGRQAGRQTDKQTDLRHPREGGALEGERVRVDQVPVEHVHLRVGHGVEVLEDDSLVVPVARRVDHHSPG